MGGRTITEEFKVHGEWWMPGSAGDRVPGTLTFKAHNVPELEILRCFQSLPALQLMAMAQKGARLPLVLGQSDDGIGWTVFGCLPTKMGTENNEPVHFYCEELLSGYVHTANAAIQFEQVHMRFTNVAEWIRPFPPQSVKTPRVRFDFSVRPKRFLQSKISTPSGVLSLHSTFSPQDTPAALTIHSGAEWSFIARPCIDLRNTLRFVRDCQNFLSFILGAPADVTRVVVLPRFTLMPKGPRQVAELIYATTKSTSDNEFFAPDALFQFDDLRPSPGKILGEWFNLQPKIREVISLVLASRYVRGYLTTEFLNVIQALESMHRRLFGGTYCPDNEYVKIEKALIDALPRTINKDLRQRLKSSYQYANEFNLRKRLAGLVDSLAPATQARIASDRKAFFDKVINTRNYLTHLNEESRVISYLADEDDLQEISFATRILTALATVTLAKAIGINEETAAARAFRLLR